MNRVARDKARARYTAAQSLSDALSRHLDVPTAPTRDGRVIVYATRRRGQEAQQALHAYLQEREASRTVLAIRNTDPRLTILEVSGAR